MLRTFLSLALVLTLSGFLSAADDVKDKTKAGHKYQATITKIDASNGTVTVKMKDNSGKDVEKLFRLTGDLRYFDSTGKAVAIDVFQSGDTVLLFEAEGRLKEIRRGGGTTGQALSANEFLKAVAEIDLAETKFGELAQNAGQAPMIKKFGERMVTDHSKMHAQLRELAKTQSVKLPGALDQKHQEFFDKLSKVKGSEFDREYARDMVSGHEKAIQKFEAQAQNGQDANVKAWAEKWLPTLREHLKMARAAAKEISSNR